MVSTGYFRRPIRYKISPDCPLPEAANNPHSLGKYLGLFLGVAVFVMVGFEHCVANMFYFSVAGVWNGQALLAILIMTVGNAAGGLIFPLCRKLQEHVKGESK